MLRRTYDGSQFQSDLGLGLDRSQQYTACQPGAERGRKGEPVCVDLVFISSPFRPSLRGDATPCQGKVFLPSESSLEPLTDSLKGALH